MRHTKEIYDLVRALTMPYPGAYTHYQGRKLLVWAAEPAPPAHYVGRIPGRVAGFSTAEGWVDVLTGDGTLRLKQVQLEGEAPTAPSSVVHSVRVSLGLHPVDLLARIQELEKQLKEQID